MSRCLGIGWLVFAVWFNAAAGAGWGIDQLMANLAENPGGRVAFSETRYLQLLDKPIESSGYLVYRRPDHLERHTERPKKETMILDGNKAILTDDSGTTRVDMRFYPQLAGVIGSVRSALAGDRRALEFYYRLRLRGTPQDWKLELIPDDDRIEPYVDKILISGTAQGVNTFEIDQADGDRSVTRIAPVQH